MAGAADTPPDTGRWWTGQEILRTEFERLIRDGPALASEVTSETQNRCGEKGMLLH